MDCTNKKRKSSIVVKFMARGMRPGVSIECWLRQFPKTKPHWGQCHFVFDRQERDYDWLVVYHDLFRAKGTLSMEKLSCPKEKSILVTTEPSSITVYGSDYLRQFGLIITSQEEWAISHPNVIFSQPGLIWHYGFPFSEGSRFINFDEMVQAEPPEKSKSISTVCSSRTGRLTLHSRRVDFTDQLQRRIPALDRFGHGVNPMVDKAEALDPYMYHLTVENHICPHHLTEKLPDAFLGFTLPFYHGAPNASEYFPLESFIPVDIGDLEKTVDIITSTINNNEYEDRLPYIIEARRRVLEEHNLFALLDRLISQRDSSIEARCQGDVIMNRQTQRIKHPLIGIRSITEKILLKSKQRLGLYD